MAKIISNERRKEILQMLNRKDDWFVCHKATLAGTQVMCRGTTSNAPTAGLHGWPRRWGSNRIL
jgi:hypothetical protein